MNGRMRRERARNKYTEGGRKRMIAVKRERRGGRKRR